MCTQCLYYTVAVPRAIHLANHFTLIGDQGGLIYYNCGPPPPSLSLSHQPTTGNTILHFLCFIKH